MRVVFYSGVFARFGGIEEFTLDLAMALRSAGASVRIVCASSRKNPALEQLEEAGVEVWRGLFRFGCSWNIPDYTLLPKALHAMRDADVVIHQKPFKGWFYRLFSRNPKHLYLTSYHPTEQFGNRSAIKEFFSFFDGILTQADSFEEELRESGIDQPVYVLPLIPPKVSSLDAPRNEDGILRIGMMGRLAPQKNPLYALEIVEELSGMSGAGFKAVELHIYGDGRLAAELKQRAGSLRFGVTFHGAYSRREIEDIVASNDCFLITSISEGQCIVALEILAGGRPVFATPVGALPGILSRAGRGALLPAGDAPVAAECIRRWIAEHGLVSAASIKESYLSDFNAAGIKDRYVALIRQVAEAE